MPEPMPRLSPRKTATARLPAIAPFRKIFSTVIGRSRTRSPVACDTRHSAPPILLPPHRDPSRRARSLVLGCGARHVGGTDAFEREAVAQALIDDAAQLLGGGDPGVAAGGRRAPA